MTEEEREAAEKEMREIEHLQGRAIIGAEPMARDEFMALSERRNALSAALAAARAAAV